MGFGHHRQGRLSSARTGPDREPGPVSQTDAVAGPPLLAGSAAIEVRHLTKDFGGRTAVADVSFSVARGEVFGFLGPNGAGKTTTVRILGTLIAATAGSAAVAGIPVGPASAAQIRQRISIMPESSGLYQRLTVTESLAISARATDTRVAQQLSILASLPPVALAALMSFQVISPTFTLAAALAGVLLAFDCGACLLVARLFDRERLVTGRQH